MNTLRLAAAIAVIILIPATAQARHRHYHHHYKHHDNRVMQETRLEPSGCTYDNDGKTICMGMAKPNQQRVVRSERVVDRKPRKQIVEKEKQESSQETMSRENGGGVVGRRPRGCPYQFCGCEASLYLFGKIIPRLNLAYNWIRDFERTSPAPGMAAARNHHVMVLKSHIAGNDWLVHDGNSGGHLTREHVRSIAGYIIVNPRATKMAMK